MIDYLLELGKRPAAVVMNMAYVKCDGGVVHPFGEGEEVKKLVEMHKIPLTKVPINPRLEDYIGEIYSYRGIVYEAIQTLSKVI